MVQLQKILFHRGAKLSKRFMSSENPSFFTIKESSNTQFLLSAILKL